MEVSELSDDDESARGGQVGNNQEGGWSRRFPVLKMAIGGSNNEEGGWSRGFPVLKMAIGGECRRRSRKRRMRRRRRNGLLYIRTRIY